MNKPPLEYFGPDAQPRPPRRNSIGNHIWFAAGLVLAIISVYIWIRRYDERFFGGGDYWDRFFYWVLTPLTLLAWLAWTVWAVLRVYRRRLRARWLTFLIWPIVCSFLILTSLNTYLDAQGMGSEYIDRMERLVDRLTHW